MTSIPDFSAIKLQPGNTPPQEGGYAAWAERFKAKTGKSPEEFLWETPEKLMVKPLYHAADLEGLDHLDTMSGMPPFLRGPYSTMYVTRPWTIRQYAGFSTAKDSNA
ncbi:MAG TPA: methylmalonyl-CoA mutase family protein, partial [Rhodospirillales bacterium]|nr:methylmalonyl-CoA mutase family protein [Rhodospirillales bacterium]